MYAPMPVVGLDEPSYSVGEVAAVFGVDPATVRRWLKTKRMTYVRIPSGGLRIPESAVANSVTIHVATVLASRLENLQPAPA